MPDKSLKVKKMLLFFGDILILYFSLWLTLIMRYANEYQWFKHLLPFTVVFAIIVVIFYIDGLYDFDFTKNKTVILNKLALSLGIGAILAATLFYFTQDRIFTIRPQRVLLIDIFVSFIFLFLWRVFFYYFVQSPKFSNNILVISDNELAKDVMYKITHNPQLGFTLKAILVNAILVNGEQKFTNPKNIHVFSSQSDLASVCRDYHIRTIVFPDKLKENEELLKNLFSCLPLNMVFYQLSTFYERITGKIPVDFIQHIWFLQNFQEGSKRTYELFKRFFDLFLSLLLLLIFLPLIPLIVTLIKMNDPGPALFKQIRVGKNGKKFMAVKFRTMQLDAENTGPQWAQKNDPRVIRTGNFLRKTRLDEIPQLWNILRGEMSLIGPRPERPEFVEQLKIQIPFYEERLLVKPGLTGWAQVMGPSYGGSLEETLEKIQYDLFYIKNRSLGLDISIILKTIKTILSRRGQ